MKRLLVFFAIALTVSWTVAYGRFLVAAQERTQYAGQDKREIKSLSESDLEQLRSGKGWGLAKPAELNGYPGPVHLLEMKDEIGLSASQVTQVQKLYSDMKEKAVPLGLRLIELERELDQSFAGRSVSRKGLQSTLDKIGNVRSELRFAHLAAHLETTRILSAEQVEKYNRLRGYEAGDPCKNIPEGHDPEMWKKHNGCES